MQTQPKPVQRPSTGSRNWTGPRTINVPRDADGYGFTLRYFVVYPPSCVYKGVSCCVASICNIGCLLIAI